MSQAEINKLYRLQSIGGPEIIKSLQEINRLFREIRKEKQQLATQRTQVEDPAELEKISKKLEELRLREKELAVSLKEKQIELKNEQILQKQLSLQRQQEQNERRQQAAGNNALAGSYNDIAKRYRELLAVTKNGTDLGNPAEVARATAELKRYKDQLDAFNRSLSSDGTLVGEYTSGIVEAFKRLGAGDLIKDKIDRDRDAVQKLDQEFEKLKQDISDIRVTGQGSLQAVEADMVANRQEAQRLEQQLNEINAAFQRQQGIGGQVVAGIREEFRNAGRDLRQFVIGYLGFQAILTGTKEVFGDTIRLDSQASALEVVSKNTEELARNEQFLEEVTDRLGLQVLDSTQNFKGFYAAATEAGIAADETRNIYEAAASAAANLKLSQADTNGVLLAFGQIASKGKVQAEELRGQIGERIPGAFAIAARAIGVTQAQLNKMLENGEVLAVDFLPKFARELQKTFGSESTERVEGLQASINRLRNQATQLVAENREGLTTFLSGFIKAGGVLLSIIGLITGNLPLVTTLLIAWAVGWGVLNKEIVIANGRLLLLNTQIIAGRIALGAITLYTTAYTAALAIFTGATSVASGAMRIFNSVILANPLGIILAVLGLVIAGLTAFAGVTNGSTAALKENARQLQLNADLQKAVNDATVGQINKIQELTRNILSNKVALEDKKKALADLIALNPDYLNGLTLENIKTREGIGLILRYTQALRDKAQVEAISAGREKALARQTEAKMNLERAGNDEGYAKRVYADLEKQNSTFFSTPAISALLDAVRFGTPRSEQALVKQYFSDMYKEATQDINFYDSAATKRAEENAKKMQASENRIHTETMGEKRKRLEKDIEDNKKRISALEATDLAGAERLRKSNEAIQKEIDKIDGKETKEKAYGGARISGVEKDRLAVIDARMNSEIKAANDRMDIARHEREVSENEEVKHVENLKKIQVDAINEKLKLLSNGNAAEQKKAGDLKTELTKISQSTADAIYKIRSEGLERVRSKAFEDAADKRSAVDENPESTAAQKARAASTYYKEIGAAQKVFNDGMDKLEKDLAVVSKKNADDRMKELRKINRDGNKAIREDTIADLDQQIAEEEKMYGKSTTKVLEAMGKKIAAIAKSGGSPASKQKKIQEVKDATESSLLEDEIKSLAEQEAIVNDAHTRGIIGEEEYSKRLLDITKRRTEAIGKLLELQTKKEYTEAEKRKLILDFAFDNAQRISSAWIQNQSREIDQDTQKTATIIQNDKERRLSQATSAEERAQIEKEYAAKSAALEKKRAREQKELARKQMIIEYALATIKIFATQGFFSPKAWTDFALLSGNFAVGMALLQAQTFEKGGALGHILRAGGRFSGPSHANGGIKFMYGGQPTEVEGNEGFVINKSSMASQKQMTVSGTPAQIASAANVAGGGVNFAPGAYMQYYAFGGPLGASLRPPMYIASSTASNSGSIDRLTDIMLEQQEIFRRQQDQLATVQEQVDLMKIAVPVDRLSQVQGRMKKADSIGTL